MDYKFIDYYTRVQKAFSKEYNFDKLKEGDLAPSFTIKRTTVENELSENYFKRKILLIEFWGLYCVPCLKVNPKIEEIRDKYKNDVQVIAVNNNGQKEYNQLFSYINKNKLQNWLHVFTNNEIQLKSDLIFKGDFSNYEGLTVPRTILIDKSGKVVYKKNGYSNDGLNELEYLIERLVKDKL